MSRFYTGKHTPTTASFLLAHSFETLTAPSPSARERRLPNMADGRRNTDLTEISASLRSFAAKGNPTKEQQFQRRHLFQRIIHHLTIGIDMSPLFSDVIMNAHTTDMATKKMLYHYITYYAQAKADLALLTVNTLQKDGMNENPVIRGLAIRSMASIRVPDLVEYLVSFFKFDCVCVWCPVCECSAKRRAVALACTIVAKNANSADGVDVRLVRARGALVTLPWKTFPSSWGVGGWGHEDRPRGSSQLQATLKMFSLLFTIVFFYSFFYSPTPQLHKIC